MSQGTLYADQKIRGVIPKAIIKAYNLDVKVVSELDDATFQKTFPLKQIPAFIGPKGLKLTEIIAVSLYRMFNAFIYVMRNFYLNSYPCLNTLCRGFTTL